MGFNVNVNSRPPHRPSVPPGTYAAVCTRLIDLGTQSVQDFQAPTFSLKRQVQISFEIPKCRVKDKEGKDKAAMLSSTFTLSLDPKAKLRKMLDAINVPVPKKGDIDLSKLLGMGVLLTVSHSDPKDDGSVWESIKGYMGLPDGMPCPKPETKLIEYSITGLGGEFVLPPESIPEWTRNKIMDSQEAKATKGGGGGGGGIDPNDTPF